jgi:hypothetical protein
MDKPQTTELADAAWRVLDDMGRDGLSCCGFAKARLRIALGYINDPDPDAQLEFTLADATKIIRECDQ